MFQLLIHREKEEKRGYRIAKRTNEERVGDDAYADETKEKYISKNKA